MNRRQLLATTGAVASFGLCAGIVAGVPGCTPAPAAETASASVAAAIDAHRAAVRHDDGLYDSNGKPLHSVEVLEASDRAIAATFAVLLAAPCRSAQDAAEKARHILAGSVGLRAEGWSDEFLILIFPDGADLFDAEGPFIAFMRSLVPQTELRG